MRLDDEDTGSVQLVPQTHGMDVPSACTIVIIAGKWWHTGGQSKDIYKIIYAGGLTVVWAQGISAVMEDPVFCKNWRIIQG